MSNRPDFRQVAHGLVEQLITDRRDLHQHPGKAADGEGVGVDAAVRLAARGFDDQ